MTSLKEYRQSIKRLLEAEDTDKAFRDEGSGEQVIALVSRSKSFVAVRSALRDKDATVKRQ